MGTKKSRVSINVVSCERFAVIMATVPVDSLAGVVSASSIGSSFVSQDLQCSSAPRTSDATLIERKSGTVSGAPTASSATWTSQHMSHVPLHRALETYHICYLHSWPLIGQIGGASPFVIKKLDFDTVRPRMPLRFDLV